MAAIKLTEKTIEEIARPVSGNRVTYDSDVKGFGVRTTASGARSFVLNYRAGGRERRLTIGSWPDWKVTAAREEAKRLKRSVDMGADPMGDRHAERSAPTVARLAERYLEEHAVAKNRSRSVREARSLLKQHVLPALGRLRVAAVQRDDIVALHAEISKRTPVRANRALSLLKKMFNLACEWKWRTDNPCVRIERNAEERRERHLLPAELQRLTAALDAHRKQSSANAVRLLLLTGARRGEVLGATWDQFDLSAGVWTKAAATTKQKKLHRVPLSAPVRQLLTTMRAASEASSLFPGQGGAESQTDLKRFWASVCKAADIKGVRIHDLRHTYASYLASAGFSLPVIGALLGHSSPATTQRYAHLLDDPLRLATERVGRIVRDANKISARAAGAARR